MSKIQQGRGKKIKRPHKLDTSSDYDKVTKNVDAKIKGRKYSRLTKAVLPK